MLADTVEAACRTLDNPSVSRLDKFIQQLINAKIEHHQFDNCPLTFRDVTLIHDSFVQLLTGYYHSRIEYPEQKDPDKKNVEADGRPAENGRPADEVKKNA
jgi:membrane-associated HD superfamily phosphohydrolase